MEPRINTIMQNHKLNQIKLPSSLLYTFCLGVYPLDVVLMGSPAKARCGHDIRALAGDPISTTSGDEAMFR